ncbi:MAG: sulfotransferase, partial [Planctomycetota bacterium]
MTPPKAAQKFQRGQLLLQQRDIPGGVKLIREAADAGRSSAELQLAAAQRLHSLGRVDDAGELYRRAIKLDHTSLNARVGLGQCLKAKGDTEAALEMFDRAVAMQPESFFAAANRAEALVDLGDAGPALEAVSSLESLTGDANAPATIALLRARLSPKAIEPDEVIPQLEHANASLTKLPPRMRGMLLGELGRLQERRERYDRAFVAYAESKRVFRPPWDPDQHDARIAQQIHAWTNAWEAVPGATDPGPEIVFILGMPRSGTTLIEQMLTQLDGIVPGGEQSAISQTVAGHETQPPMVQPLLTDPASLDQRAVDRLAAEAARFYALRIKRSKTDAFTDKQPGNYFYIPLILKLFPRARIVHCVRDAMDVCLSNFAISFARPRPETHDLAHLGRYYLAYEQLVEAARPLAGDRMTDAVYEDVVADTETHAKRLVGFLGRPWDDRVLRFYESDRTVRTASRE